MIRINLLQQQPGSAASAGPSSPQSGGVLVALILIVAFGVTGGTFYHFYSQKDREVRAAAEAKTRADELAERSRRLTQEFQELQANLAILSRQQEVLSLLDPEDRLFWAQKLNILPLFVPDGVFLTQLEVKETVREEETAESRRRTDEWVRGGRRGTPPPRDMRPIITQTLDVKGVSYVADGTSDQRLGLVIDFHNALSNNEVEVPFDGSTVKFVDQMSNLIDFKPIEETRIQNREVTQFHFTLTSTQRPVARPIGEVTRDTRTGS